MALRQLSGCLQVLSSSTACTCSSNSNMLRGAMQTFTHATAASHGASGPKHAARSSCHVPALHSIRRYSIPADANSQAAPASQQHQQQPPSGAEDAWSASSSFSSEWDDGDEGQSSPADRKEAVQRILRTCLAAERAAVGYFEGQRLVLRGRVDAQYFREQEGQQLAAVQELVPKHRTRPSLLQGALGCAGVALGAAAALAPRGVSLAVSGAVHDALSEHYNDQLRVLREAGAAEEALDVREALRALRDVERAPEGAPQPPDLLALQRAERISDLGVEGVVGAVVKTAARVALEAAARV